MIGNAYASWKHKVHNEKRDTTVNMVKMVPYTDSEGCDQTAQRMRSLITAFIVRL